jgi:predicted transcriptional regulator
MSEEEIKEFVDFLNEEPEIKVLSEEEKNILYFDNLYNKLTFEYIELSKENQQLQNNWNELKKHLKEVIGEIENNEYADAYDNCELATTRTIFRKMQELENRKV